jgi:sulfur-oxidizing protein SoxB
MNMSRREFLQMLAIGAAAGLSLPGCSKSGNSTGSAKFAKAPADFYDIPKYGNVSFMHFTDCHAQLMPIWFREPNVNLGVAKMNGRVPHLVGENFLKHFKIDPKTAMAHAHTYIDFTEAAKFYGKVGGFSHLATLVKKVRGERPHALLLDGGDTWQGSATSLWTQGQDMVDACKILGVDMMTGHWEFTYGMEQVRTLIDSMSDKIDFLAQNIIDNEWEERVFKPYKMVEMNGVPVAVIGQAFPYTPIANPRYMVEDWRFGIRDEEMQKMVNLVREREKAQVVVVLSHNGMDVDLKMASRVTGIDAILGGHTHDPVPYPTTVKNAGGETIVANSGSNGKFLSVLDFDVRDGKVKGFQYRSLPVFSNLLEADKEMAAYINKVREPFKDKLNEPLAVTDDLLYRRGNFNGTFDQLILDALMTELDCEIAFSPGFRWGVSKLPGETITMEDLMTQTAITYPQTTITEQKGEFIKAILEDVGDNLFNKDPYYQQGGDMVRVGGLKYSMDPSAEIGGRISDMTLNGKPIDPNKTYKVAGWASVQKDVKGHGDVWDVVARYLKDKKTVSIKELNEPVIKGMKDNPGIA